MLTSLLALVAMIFSFGEAVAASACAPDMGMEMHHVGQMHAPDGGAILPGSLDREHGEPDEPTRHCPFGPAVTGCTGVASFPSRVSSDIVPPLRAECAAFSQPTQQRLLLANALFRPPRA